MAYATPYDAEDAFDSSAADVSELPPDLNVPPPPAVVAESVGANDRTFRSRH